MQFDLSGMIKHKINPLKINKIKAAINYFKKEDFFNFLSNWKYNLSFKVENADWAIKWEGKQITETLNKLNLIKSRLTTSHRLIKNQIIHFGSIHIFFRNGFVKIHKSNKIVVTWLHVVPDYKRNEYAPKLNKVVDVVHTSCHSTKRELIKLGIKEKKLAIIPIGVDLNLFKPVADGRKNEIKTNLGLPSDKIIIGSFQKDGVGWGTGLEPKLIKGPDIFIETIEQLSKDYPIFVLLVGPARGYVKNNLRKLKIPYKSFGFKSLPEIPQYYNAIDLYLITSRIEGGPHHILEGWASGVPVVSTKVGMVPDIAKDRGNVLLAEVENVDQLVDKTKDIFENEKLRRKLISNGLREVQNYSWERISLRHYKEIYSKLS